MNGEEDKSRPGGRAMHTELKKKEIHRDKVKEEEGGVGRPVMDTR